MTWLREEIGLGMLFTRSTFDSDAPLLYRVVALIDSPVVVLEPADARDGEEREHHVICSSNFAEFRRVQLESDEGSVQWGPGS